MKIDITEALWLDAHHPFSLMELVELSGLTVDDLQHLVDCEALLPLPAPASVTNAGESRFSAECLLLARTASRLRDDFELDANGLSVTLHLLSRIRDLEAELADLRAQLPHALR